MDPQRIICYAAQLTQQLNADGDVTYEQVVLQQIGPNEGDNKIAVNVTIVTVGAGSAEITPGLVTVDVTPGDLGPLDP